MRSRSAYLRHDGLPLLILDIAKWHLGALVLIELEIGVVDIPDLLQGG